MAHVNTLQRPSILELAQEGNCRALTYWMNSFLGPQGVHVQVQPAPDQFLKVLVDFRRPRRKEACLNLRDRLVRFICYRLWTLNSDAICGVRIVARMAGDPKVLWQLSVRINSPATAKMRRLQAASLRQMQTAHQLKFRVLRSLFMSSITLAGFFIGYWLFYLEMGRWLAKGKAAEAPALTNDPTVAQSNSEASHFPTPLKETDFSVPKEIRGKVISQVSIPGEEKFLALTFDDGPHPEATGQVLDVLKQYNVQATFFLSGANVQQSPDVARRIVAEGHMIGSRGWSPAMETGDAADPTHEVDDTAKLIQQITDVKPVLFRPPNGRLDSKLVTHAQDKQYVVTLWSVDAQDSLVAAPIVLDNVLRNAKPGRIVLLHDGLGVNNQSSTIQALPQLITALQQQGYRFVSVAELLKMQAGSSDDSSKQNDQDKQDDQNKQDNQNKQDDQNKQGDIKLPLRKPGIATASLLGTTPQDEQPNHGDTVPEAVQQHRG